MQKTILFFLCALLGSALAGCYENDSSGPDMVDPWLRERTPLNLRLESQIGAAVITDDWRDDAHGRIRVQLVTGGISDLKRVKVVAIDLQYNATASIREGSTLDLSTGEGTFVVTAENGETRQYSVSYDPFREPLEGVYVFDPVGGILDGSAPKSSLVLVGGWDGSVVMSTVMDKSWHWGNGYTPADEEDNTVSFQLARVDETSGVSYGTTLNLPGPDGKYANYLFQNNPQKDVNAFYRIIPKGRSRWSKGDDGMIVFYAWDDTQYAEPLFKVGQLEAGGHDFWGKTVSVPHLSFYRSFPGPYDWIDNNWPDDRWFVHNIRNTFYLMKKSSDAPLEDHDELLKNEY